MTNITSIGSKISSYKVIGDNKMSPELSILRILGKGVNGPVYLARTTSHPAEYYALKTINKIKDSNIANEILIHDTLNTANNNNNILKLCFCIDLEDYIIMALEYCSNGDLYDLITGSNYLSLHDNNKIIKSIFLDILKAVQYMHSCGIYHRDIKPENILIDNYNNIKLADFGLATMSKHSLHFGCGSGYYMAPEVYNNNNKPYACDKADLWSLGILFLNLCSGQNPWEVASDKDINFIEYKHNVDLIRHLFPLSEAGLQICLGLLQVNPQNRLDIQTIINLVETTDTFIINDNEPELLLDTGSLSIKSNESSILTCDSPTSTHFNHNNVNNIDSNLKQDEYHQLINDPYLYLSMFP